jgi:hypothetical protein
MALLLVIVWVRRCAWPQGGEGVIASRLGAGVRDRIKEFGRAAPRFLRCCIEGKTMSEPLIDCVRADSLLTPRDPGPPPRAVLPRLLRAAVVLAIAPLGLAACGGGPADKLEGKWVGERIDNVSAEQVARATAWVKATTLEFAGDKLTVTIPAETARKGTFKVAKVDGDKVVLSVHRKDGPPRDEATFTLQGDKSLRWDIGQNREITLVRAQ